MNELIIDGENAVLGRLASYAAKKSLQGADIYIVNCDKVIVVGKKKDILENYHKKRARGGYGAGPIFSVNVEKIMKRTIRGMLPYKHARGREALKRIKCYASMPENFKSKKMVKSARGKEGTSLKRISEMIGGR